MSLAPGARRIRATFEAAVGVRPLLVAYVVAGYPDEAGGLAAARAVLDAGADILEIGVPFSDPVADGPVIAVAAHEAVAGGAGLETALRTVRALRDAEYRQPVLAMGYLNPIVVRGAANTLAAAAAAGIDGVIIPDLPAGEDPQLERLAAAAGLGIVFLVTPNTPAERLERAIAASTAFLYVVPLYGVTGARDHVAASAIPLLRRTRAAASGRIPIAVGFGVSHPEHVRELAPAVDAIVVGSAIVAAQGRAGPAGMSRLVTSLVDALKS